MKINFLKETELKLKSVGIKTDDIKFIIVNNKKFDWENFKEISNFTYDNELGSNVINTNLQIVVNNWVMYRSNYNGVENWEFIKFPNEKDYYQTIITKTDILE